MLAIENLIEEKVIHKSFGTGIIRSVDDKYLEVDFPERNKKSKFSYPSCFNGFLTLENGQKQAEVQKDLEQWKIESGVVQKEKLRCQYEKTMQEIRARKIAAGEKKLRAMQKAREYRFHRSGVK